MRLLYQNNRRYEFSYKSRPLDYPLHLHNAAEIVFLEQGSCLVTHGSEKTRMEAGDVFISFPNQVHGYEDSRDTCRYLFILPVNPCLETFYKTVTDKVPTVPFLKKGTWEHSGLWSLVRQAYEDRNRAPETVMQGYFQVIVGKLLSMLKLQNLDAKADNAVHTVLLYIHDHYREPITRRTIAQAVGYNESYISHLFRQTLRTSLTEYIHSMRMEDALSLLVQSNLSVTEIAAQTGFGSIRNFNRIFRSQMGTTPKAYRSQKK